MDQLFKSVLCVVLCFVLSESALICSSGSGPKTEYDPRKQFCCFGKVAEKKEGLDCCEATHTFYDTNTSACCPGGIFPIPVRRIGDYLEPVPVKCCGSGLIDRSQGGNNHECCEDIRDRRRGTPYNQKTEICCSGNVYPNEDKESGCCNNGQSFNRISQICCGGKTMERKYQHTHCCNGVIYDGTKQVCKNDQVVDSECILPDGQQLDVTQCCGLTLRKNATTEQCCGDSAIPIEDTCCNNQKLGADQVCCPTLGPRDKSYPMENACCENDSSFNLYNKETAICLNKRVKERCDGLNVSNAKRNMCCDGIVTRRWSHDTECCGQESYIPRYYTCCKGQISRGRDKPCPSTEQ